MDNTNHARLNQTVVVLVRCKSFADPVTCPGPSSRRPNEVANSKLRLRRAVVWNSTPDIAKNECNKAHVSEALWKR